MPLIIRETHIKTTAGYPCTPVRLAIIKKQKIRVGKDVHRLEPLPTAGGDARWGSYEENSMEGPPKVKNRSTL